MKKHPLLKDQSLNVDDVSEIIGLSRNTVYKLAKSGELTSYRLGRKLLFTMQDVETYLESSKRGKDRSKGAPHSYDVAQTNISTEKGSTSAMSAKHSGDIPRSITEVRLPGRRVAHRDSIAIGGDDVIADIIANHCASDGMKISREHESSYCGLISLYSNAIDASLIHLYDFRTNTYNIPYVHRMVPGMAIIVIRLLNRKVGLAVNPQKSNIKTWGSLLREDIRIAARPKGYASRILLDEKLLSLECNLSETEKRIHVFDNDRQTILAVEEGLADVAIVSEDDMINATDLNFIALQEEWLDFAIAKNHHTHDFIRSCKEIISSKGFRTQVQNITTGKLDQLGAIVYEC